MWSSVTLLTAKCVLSWVTKDSRVCNYSRPVSYLNLLISFAVLHLTVLEEVSKDIARYICILVPILLRSLDISPYLTMRFFVYTRFLRITFLLRICWSWLVHFNCKLYKCFKWNWAPLTSGDTSTLKQFLEILLLTKTFIQLFFAQAQWRITFPQQKP